MIIPITEFIRLYQFTPGRRVYALRRLRDIVMAHQLDDLLPPIDEALAHEAQAAGLRASWGMAKAKAELLPSEIDPKIDRTLMLIDQMLGYHADQDDETGRYARALSAALFPEGVLQHIRLPHVDQLAANEDALIILEAAERQPWIDRLGLRMLSTSLRELNQAFGRAVRLRERPGDVRYADVRAANERGQQLLLEIVARILGRFPTPADDVLRTALLEPIAYQNEAIRLFRRRRRRVIDIDPETGEPTSQLPDDDDAAGDADDDLDAADVDQGLIDAADADVIAGSGAGPT